MARETTGKARRPARPLVHAHRPGRTTRVDLRSLPAPEDHCMQSFLIATGVVALAEIGDKTQLLSLILAARFRKPWPICIGIFVATLVNHGLAGRSEEHTSELQSRFDLV